MSILNTKTLSALLTFAVDPALFRWAKLRGPVLSGLPSAARRKSLLGCHCNASPASDNLADASIDC
jgi:hypothetical protein